MSAKRCLAVCLCLLSGTAAQAQINLAGVYELNRKVDISVHQMYLELDFVNSRPDFTQSFSGQKASFKYLPADFMNAKKLKQNFKGTTAPGFARYREKTLFTSVEEVRITNPHSKRGVILADWENNMGKKGQFVILPGEDGSLVTYGLFDIPRSLSPDGMRLELVKDLLPAESGRRWPAGVADASASASFVEEIRTQCGSDFAGAVERLRQLPDDGVTAQAGEKRSTAVTTGGSGEIGIELWGDNHPVVFKFHTIAVGGDFGKFETNSQLDFWPEDGGVICMRMEATTVYVNSGNIREYNYIYRGRREGNKIIFTHRKEAYDDEADFEPLEDYLASEVIIKSPTQIVFDRCTYTKGK